MSRWNDAPATNSSSSDFMPPTKCPACGNAGIVTTAKIPAPDSYWRCNGCGEVWNVGRRTENVRGNAKHANARYWS